jgi:hypothetical protein
MPDLVSLINRLPDGVLPAGKVISSEDGGDPVFWLSDEPASVGAWSRFRAGHSEWHLWPVFLRGEDRQPQYPWEIGEVFPARMTAADQHDVAVQMAGWWLSYTSSDNPIDFLSAEERAAVTAPFGRNWPGMCPAIAPQASPDGAADRHAESVHDNATRLGLVAVERSSDTLWVTGWGGPVNYENDTGVLAAVVRSWEERFGVRVVGMGPATLELSVAAPPVSMDQAIRVAAEHFAFCQDSVWQGSHHNLEKYAATLLNQNGWSFWWD